MFFFRNKKNMNIFWLGKKQTHLTLKAVVKFSVRKYSSSDAAEQFSTCGVHVQQKCLCPYDVINPCHAE